MIWLSVTLITITITSAIRVPTSWSNQDYVQNGLFSEVPFQNEYRARIPNAHAFNLNYVRTPSVFNSPYTMKIPSNIAVKSRKASNNSRYSDLQTTLVSNNRVPTISQNNKHKYVNENNIVQDPNNNQETPKEVPTKVNYPGVGKWAIRGVKHKPYLHTPKYVEIKSENKKPEGYDIFERARPTFDRQKQELVNNFLPHRKTKRVNYKAEDSTKDDNKIDFVPSQLLSQVRRVDTEEHLPPVEDEPRLREIIKDSKVHVMYTEEGYEDIGYDHAGEERNAEENEGHSIRDSGPTKPLKPVPVPVNILREFENYEDVTKEDLGKSESKPRPRYQKNVSKHPLSTQDELFKRHKRFVNDIPNVQIEDYLVETDESTTPPVKQKRKKYPYYSFETLKHSPLRYAEDIRNIPKKDEGELSFYDHSGASICPEIPLNINPIPHKVEREKPVNQSNPRLQKLGDKIACLKSKYFGENPLDNPLFRESEVEEPQLNFAEFIRTLSHRKRQKRNAQSLDDTSQATAVKENKLDEPLPEQAALTVRIVRRKFRLPSSSKIRYGSNNYLTTAPPFFSPRSTVLPKYKTISEVYYKDEIQPNEQLNVFSDVMNNIKKTRVDLVSAGSEIVENETPLEPEGQTSRIKIKVPQKKIKIRQTSTTSYWTPSTSTTTEQAYSLPPRKNKHKNHKQDLQLYEEYVNTIKQNEHKKKGELDEYGKEEVLGLSPPIPPSVTLTTPSIFEDDKADQVVLNLYPVAGMNPPTIQQSVPYYSFVNTAPLNRVRRKNQYRRIYKRSVNKLAYSEIRRKRPNPVPTDEVDDYVPQRNRNFRYDH
ncbi:hypothetical protein RI129_009855 [Pyrocoelia pectoralis]|uniref:Uncharacterized protein n=1 Tax=Pyrocoelia pectoralis TaxID=417401 RepID=A0AAN7V6W8_9COLE